MSILIWVSIGLTLIISGAWKLVSNRNHRKAGLWIAFLSYLILVTMYWLDHVSLWWLTPVVIVSTFLGVIWSSRGARRLLFQSGSKSPTKIKQQPVESVKGIQANSKEKKLTAIDYANELERRGFQLTASNRKRLGDMTVPELLKDAMNNGINIEANK